MEPSPSTTYTPHNPEKSMFKGSESGSSGISASMPEGVVEFPTPTSFVESKSLEHKQIICHEMIDVNKDGHAEDLFFLDAIDEKLIQNGKGKISVPSYISDLDVAPTDMVHSSDGFGPLPQNWTLADMNNHDINFSDDDMIDDEFAMLQAHFDSIEISPEEAAIPWWVSPEGGKTKVVSASSSGFLSPTSFFNPGASKTDDSPSSTSYDGTSQAGVHVSKSIWEPFPGKKSYHGPGKLASHIQKKLGTLSSASDAEVGNLLPSGTPYSPNFMNMKMLQLSNTSSGANNHFPGWKIQAVDELTFPGSELTSHKFTGGFMGGFPYMQDPSTVLDQGVSAEISVPSYLASSNQDGGEVLILKRLESFKKFDTVQDHSDHHYSSKNQCRPLKDWVKKIQEEWRILENDLPDTILVRVYETRMDLLRAVIIGADGTPYHDNIFFFDFHFPAAYPNVPPLVYYHSGGLRLNPNLYNSGKVCLSLLNTWSGDGNEKWVPGLSTVLQVLVSIQGLILNAEPYYNEPGYEGMAGTPDGEKWSRRYSENAFLLSLKTMLYSMRQPPKHFEDLVFGHFYKRGHDILIACKAYLDGAQVGTLVEGAIQGANKTCSNTFKTNLPVYINSLVKAFTKIGVSDCEKYVVPGDKNDDAVSKTTSSSPDGFEFKPLQKPDGFEFNPQQKFDHLDGVNA